MVLQMRGTIRPGHKWDVMVDLFFYREPEEAKQQEEEEAVAIPDYRLVDYSAPPLASDQWPVQVAATQWNPHVQHPISAVPTTWATEPVALAAGDWDAAPAPPVTTNVIEGAASPAALASGWGE